jgi:hypothetical protein
VEFYFELSFWGFLSSMTTSRRGVTVHDGWRSYPQIASSGLWIVSFPYCSPMFPLVCMVLSFWTNSPLCQKKRWDSPAYVVWILVDCDICWLCCCFRGHGDQQPSPSLFSGKNELLITTIIWTLDEWYMVGTHSPVKHTNTHLKLTIFIHFPCSPRKSSALWLCWLVLETPSSRCTQPELVEAKVEWRFGLVVFACSDSRNYLLEKGTLGFQSNNQITS